MLALCLITHWWFNQSRCSCLKVAPENASTILLDIAGGSRELVLFSLKLPLFLFFLVLLYVKKNHNWWPSVRICVVLNFSEGQGNFFFFMKVDFSALELVSKVNVKWCISCTLKIVILSLASYSTRNLWKRCCFSLCVARTLGLEIILHSATVTADVNAMTI